MKFTQSIKEIGQPTSHKRKHAYDIQHTLGHGEFGEVKYAEETATGEKVAIKVVTKSNYRNLEAQKHRLEKFGTMSHPNLMHMKEWFESRDRYYFVLQYMSGGELYDWVEKEGSLSENVARHITKQLLSGIAYLHEHHIVHRDIKLENILISEDHEHVVIGDMGLSASLREEDSQLFAVCGSLGYTAPEVHDRTGYSKPVDLWSLGVVVFLMLGGRFPYLGNDAATVAKEGKDRNIRFTRKPPWTNVSDLAKDFIRKLLEPDAEKRLTAEQALQHPWILEELPDSTIKSINDAALHAHEHDDHHNGMDVDHPPPLQRRVTDTPKNAPNYQGGEGLAIQRTDTKTDRQDDENHRLVV